MRISIVLSFTIILVLTCCSQKKHDGMEAITNAVLQEELFSKLASINNYSIAQDAINDSLAFLILPMQASCSSCRNKTIDSIDSRKAKLDNKHLIILSGNSRKSIINYFKERKKASPESESRIILDTNERAFKDDLSSTNPVIYYAYNKKVYLKVSCSPATIKADLGAFFSK